MEQNASRVAVFQEADVGAEEIFGRVQPRGTVRAHPPHPQSPGVHLQVHRSLAHALLPVSLTR